MDEYISKTELLKVINTDIAEAHNERCVQLLNAILYATTADVVPKSEVEWLEEMVVDKCNRCLKRWSEVTAKEIFEEIEGSIAVHAFTSKSEDYADGMYDAIEWVDSKIAELKKKYTEGKE